MLFAPLGRTLADVAPESGPPPSDVVINLIVAAAVVGLIVFAFIAVQRRSQRREQGDHDQPR